MWEYVKNLDIGIFSVDNEMDIDETCEFFADSKMIAGNVAPVYTICNGTQENIEDEVKRCILAGKKCKKDLCSLRDATSPSQQQMKR